MVDRRGFIGLAAASFAAGVDPGAAAPALPTLPRLRPIGRPIPLPKGAKSPPIALGLSSVCAFLGYSHPLKTPPATFGQPIAIASYNDYQRQFGGAFASVACASEAAAFADLSWAVQQFFLNGGTAAVVTALNNPALPRTGAVLQLGPISFTALEITDAASTMTVSVVPAAIAGPPGDPRADVTLTYGPISGPGAAVTERFTSVSLNRVLADGVTPNRNFIETRVGTAAAPVSSLARVAVTATAGFAFTVQPQVLGDYATGAPIFSAADFTAALAANTPLDQTAGLGLMVLPGVVDVGAIQAAVNFCGRRRAFLFMDPPIDAGITGALTIMAVATDPHRPHSANAALYFPYLQGPDPRTGATSAFPPAASAAGVCARTDAGGGVWKAPAGVGATVAGATGLAPNGQMSDAILDTLTPLGINCLRRLPAAGGIAVWGARTFQTSDQQWRYVPVRRMALYLETTLVQGLAWTVFEPNAEPLWAQIRLSVGGLMYTLFRNGAFQGSTPTQAYFVKCDSETTNATDIANGVVNLVVGFAPLMPAEFVVMQIQPLAGQG